MVSEVSLCRPQVYFRGEDDKSAASVINSPGQFTTQPMPEDSVEISSNVEEGAASEAGKGKSGGGFLKTAAKVLGGAVVLLGASFGMYKWKGAKWLMPENKGFIAGCKKWLVKPGEFVNDKVIMPIINKFSSKKTEDIVEAIVEDIAEG